MIGLGLGLRHHDRKKTKRSMSHHDTMTVTDNTHTDSALITPSIDELRAVPGGEGDHYFFLNHLASVKIRAGGSGTGMSLVEFTAPRGFGPPLHVHHEEDEILYVLDGEVRIGASEDSGPVLGAGGVASLPHGVPHTFQVISDGARMLTISSGRHNNPSFDRFVAALGVPADPTALPEPGPVDPAHVAAVCADHGMTVLGPPPPDLD